MQLMAVWETLRRLYAEGLELNDEASKLDPPENPYKSKYEAREKWKTAQVELRELIQKLNDNAEILKPQSFGGISMLEKARLAHAVILSRLGSNFTECEELSDGEKLLTESLSILQSLSTATTPSTLSSTASRVSAPASAQATNCEFVSGCGGAGDGYGENTAFLTPLSTNDSDVPPSSNSTGLDSSTPLDSEDIQLVESSNDVNRDSGTTETVSSMTMSPAALGALCPLQLTLNALGVLWSHRRQHEKALALLTQAESAYLQWSEEARGGSDVTQNSGDVTNLAGNVTDKSVGGHGVGKPEAITSVAESVTENDGDDVNDLAASSDSFTFTGPLTEEAIFMLSLDDRQTTRTAGIDLCESHYTHTLYYLAQVHGAMEKPRESARYCHTTLRRQLERRDELNPVDWALNAATLSQYYVGEGEYEQARHCLECSSSVFKETGPVQVTDIDGSLCQKAADISRCWVKYCIALLEDSVQRMVEEITVGEKEAGVAGDAEKLLKDFESFGIAEPQTPSCTLTPDDHDPNSSTTNPPDGIMDLPNGCDAEGPVSPGFARTFPSARRHFLLAQRHLAAARIFYTWADRCSGFIEISRDGSRLFKLLLFFEDDASRRCRMHKRRADLLEPFVNELSPKYYLLVWRQIVYELAEIYSAMLDGKMAAAALEQEARREGGGAASRALSRKAAKKVNALGEKSIEYFRQYVDSLQRGGKYKDESGSFSGEAAQPKGDNEESSKEPDGPFPSGDERPALVAWFCTGRLCSKLIASDALEAIQYQQKSLSSYRKVVEYCKLFPEHGRLVKEELDVCEDMVQLLPLKISKMAAALNP